MKRVSWARSAISVILLSIALAVLYRQSRRVDLAEMLDHVRSLPHWRLGAAASLTLLNFAQLTAYDVIGLHQIERPLPYRRVALASFIATAFAHNVGPSLASGGSIRYRFFGAWGLSATDVGALLAFGVITFLSGFSLVGGLVLSSAAISPPENSPIPAKVLAVVGVVLLILVSLYLVSSILGKRNVTIRGRVFDTPSPRIVVAQILVAGLDWLFMAAVLKLLLPPGLIDYVPLLRVFVLSQILAMISQVPGGLGVFESLMLTSLTPGLSVSVVLSTLLLYRIIYLLFPLGLATLALSISELSRGALDLDGKRAPSRSTSRP